MRLVEQPVDHDAGRTRADAARTYVHVHDPVNAARVLTAADRIAPAEIRHRPAGRDVLARVAREPHAPATITDLAASLGAG
ncbi:hypothetical protein GCM10027186_32300 [Micromonospora schwarzwaldensis]